jgi:hypothetical protein
MPITGVLSNALIVAAMLVTPAMAHENAAAHRYLPAGDANAAVHHVEGHGGMSAPHVHAFAVAPGDAQGAACDVGDTARLC